MCTIFCNVVRYMLLPNESRHRETLSAYFLSSQAFDGSINLTVKAQRSRLPISFLLPIRYTKIEVLTRWQPSLKYVR